MTTCRAKLVVVTACPLPFTAARLLEDLFMRLRRTTRCRSLLQDYVLCEAGCRGSLCSAFTAARLLEDLFMRLRRMPRYCSLLQEDMQSEAGCRDSVCSAIHDCACAVERAYAPAADAAVLLSDK